MVDWDKILKHGDTFLQVASMAKDKLIEGINKDIERQRDAAREEVTELKERLMFAERELEDMTQRFHDARNEADRLRAEEAK